MTPTKFGCFRKAASPFFQPSGEAEARRDRCGRSLSRRRTLQFFSERIEKTAIRGPVDWA
jgi:hypothetical protein